MPFIYGELEGTAFRRLQREISQLSEPDSYHSMAVSRIKSLEGHLRFVGNESAVANHPPRHGLHCHGHGREGRRSLLVPTLPEKCSTINAKRSCSRKHDTGPSTEAREKTSRDYIKTGRGVITDQTCLLPTSMNKENVDYVVIFYSKVLAKYMGDERTFRTDNKTYPDAVFDVCKQSELDSKDSQSVRSELYQLHHASTEKAILQYRNAQAKLNSTIHIITCSNDEHRKWDSDLEWDADFMNTQSSNVRIHVEPEQEYRKFFELLLQLGSNEKDGEFSKTMKDCFTRCLDSLRANVDEDQYRIVSMRNITQSWSGLSSQWEKLDRPLTPERLRDDLMLFSKIDCALLGRVTGGRLPWYICDIDLSLSTPGEM
ncbi:uncharacterized protein PV06_08360 [Exophiala oligosperma]|uniref:Uncharacterized protein n=1 Tax=Exophiala oligosperma TaxID=215243 RepID=A0A0D2DBB2_9EURO|nr:uncharacterized protein PV06_08360 [Exophiala oligosperma]KIW39775.1 hypothetical protein PV06_08360 [Exophiala oligosperma]